MFIPVAVLGGDFIFRGRNMDQIDTRGDSEVEIPMDQTKPLDRVKFMSDSI